MIVMRCDDAARSKRVGFFAGGSDVVWVCCAKFRILRFSLV